MSKNQTVESATVESNPTPYLSGKVNESTGQPILTIEDGFTGYSIRGIRSLPDSDGRKTYRRILGTAHKDSGSKVTPPTFFDANGKALTGTVKVVDLDTVEFLTSKGGGFVGGMGIVDLVNGVLIISGAERGRPTIAGESEDDFAAAILAARAAKLAAVEPDATSEPDA